MFATDGDLEGVGGLAGLLGGEDVAQVDHDAVRVGHLDADRLTAGDRSEDPHVGRRHRVGDVLVERGDPGDLDAGPELQLVAGDRGADGHADDTGLHAVLGQRRDQHVATGHDGAGVDVRDGPTG